MDTKPRTPSLPSHCGKTPCPIALARSAASKTTLTQALYQLDQPGLAKKQCLLPLPSAHDCKSSMIVHTAVVPFARCELMIRWASNSNEPFMKAVADYHQVGLSLARIFAHNYAYLCISVPFVQFRRSARRNSSARTVP